MQLHFDSSLNSDNICGYGSAVIDPVTGKFENCLCDPDQIKKAGSCTIDGERLNSKYALLMHPLDRYTV